MRVVEENTMIWVRENMNVVVLNTSQVQFIKQIQGVLEMDIVVWNAVHYQEAHILLEGGHVGDGGVVVAGRVVLRGVHVAFCIDGVWYDIKEK